VPHAASRLADLSIRDPHEPVAARVEQHLLEPHPVGDLELGALADRRAGSLDARREVVADALELAEVEQPRRAARPRRLLVEPSHRKSGHERVGEFPLELVDLGPQRPPCRPLVLLRTTQRRDRRSLNNGA
jgi:hypothetical protein